MLMPPILTEMLGMSADIATVISFPAIIIPVAIYFALKRWGPEMTLRNWQKWTLVGMFAIGVCAYVLDVSDRFGFIDLKHSNFTDDFKYNRIVSQSFDGQTVYLDGNDYVECYFHNVTLVYKGTAPFHFTHSHSQSDIRFLSPNPAINGAIGFMAFMQETNQRMGFKVVPQNDAKKLFYDPQ